MVEVFSWCQSPLPKRVSSECNLHGGPPVRRRDAQGAFWQIEIVVLNHLHVIRAGHAGEVGGCIRIHDVRWAGLDYVAPSSRHRWVVCVTGRAVTGNFVAGHHNITSVTQSGQLPRLSP